MIRTRTLPARAVEILVAAVEPLAFWSAVCLPLLFPVVLTLPSGERRPALAALVAANAVCLVLGHGHASGDLDSRDDAKGRRPVR